MEVITIATQKGETGKTTTAHALGIGLFLFSYAPKSKAAKDYKILLKNS